MEKKDIVITSCSRTAVGSLGKSLKDVSSCELGSVVISDAIKKSNIKTDDVDEIIMGQVLTSGLGQNPARQSAMKSGIPKEKPAYIVNQVCGSGIRSIVSGFQSIIVRLKNYHRWWPRKYVFGSSCDTFEKRKKIRRC